ncbi:MAG: hypothetical protein F6K54_39885, partial [Okeania sp. SIO3B5]|nr:hypothetical protein [Okeania sp. SIO3B5]
LASHRCRREVVDFSCKVVDVREGRDVFFLALRKSGRWGDGEMGRWGDGEMGRWGDGEMGRWGDGEIKKYLVMIEDGTFFYTELNGFYIISCPDD